MTGMNLLNISHTYGQIGIDVTNSKPQFDTQLAKLEFSQTNAKIQVDKQLPRVIIDQSACFSSAGLKSSGELVQQAAQDGYQQVLRYIQKKVSDGAALADTRIKSNVIAKIARNSTFDMHEFGIVCMPSVGPKIDIEGYTNISADEGKINIECQKGNIETNFTESAINMYLLQKPSLNIQYVGSNFDASV
jgi:hypothetical protein